MVSCDLTRHHKNHRAAAVTPLGSKLTPHRVSQFYIYEGCSINNEAVLITF